MPSVIFLDINGVLNPVATMRLVTLGQVVVALSPIAVGLLNRLCYETNAEVVVSSSWRLFPRRAIVRQILRAHACLNGLLESTDKSIPLRLKFFCYDPDAIESWRTPFLRNINGQVRGNEIDFWLHKWGHLIENYCILDDHPQPMLDYQRPHLVSIERNRAGFDVDYYEQALDILNNPALKSSKLTPS